LPQNGFLNCEHSKTRSRAVCECTRMGDSLEPFIGSEALTRGALNRHQLRTRYRAVFPNVYLPKHIQPSIDQRVMAAWLWSQRLWRALESGDSTVR
jgi:hypothetical protein